MGDPLGSTCTWPMHFQATKGLCEGCKEGYYGESCDLVADHIKRIDVSDMTEEQLVTWHRAYNELTIQPSAHPVEYWTIRLTHEMHNTMHGSTSISSIDAYSWPLWPHFLQYHMI